MKKQIVACLVLMNFCVLNVVEGQDIHFSQFSASPLTINPGATGVFKGDQRVAVNYKDQWRSISTPYVTYALALDGRVFKQKITKGAVGVGLTAFRDKAGDAEMGTAQVNLSTSYHVALNDKSSMSAGIQGGFAQRSINASVLQWGDQDDGISGYNASIPTSETNKFDNFSYGDFAAGLMWNYNTDQKNMTSNDGLNVNVGAAIFHINRPRGGFYSGAAERLYAKIVLHGVASIGLKNTNISLQPGILFFQQGPLQEILTGMMFRYQVHEESKYTGLEKGAAVSIGAHYRVGDAIIPSVLFEYSHYAIGVSYEINTSDLKVASNGRGGIEISLRFVNPNPFKASSYRHGPSFF